MPITLKILDHTATLDQGEWTFEPEDSSISGPVLKLYDPGNVTPADAYGQQEAARVADLIGAEISSRSPDLPPADRTTSAVDP